MTTYSIVKQKDGYAIFEVTFNGARARSERVAFKINNLGLAARIVMYLHITIGDVKRAVKLAKAG